MKILNKCFGRLLVIGLALLAVGCAGTPQATVKMDKNLISDDTEVGIVTLLPSKATTHIYGAGCLLCYGVASGLTATLDTHLESTISTDELEQIKAIVVDKYTSLTSKTTVVDAIDIDKLKSFSGGLGFAKKDFRPLKEELGKDVLVVLQIDAHGAHRLFSSYFPQSDPKGYIAGLLYSVDLNTNAYLQYKVIDEKVQPDGDWDEPPTFPAVTTSYYQAAEDVKRDVKLHLE